MGPGRNFLSQPRLGSGPVVLCLPQIDVRVVVGEFISIALGHLLKAECGLGFN